MSRVSIIIQETSESLFIDATTTEKHTPSANVANHPIEGGGQITDHAEEQLENITVEGVITDQPAPELRIGAGVSRVERARNFLERAAEKRLRLVTPKYGVFQPVVLKKWSQTISAPLDSVEVNLQFQEMEFAEWETAQLPPDQVQEPTMSSKCTCGTQSPSDTESEQANGLLELVRPNRGPQDKSFLQSGLDGITSKLRE